MKAPQLTNHAKVRMRDRTGLGRKKDMQREFKMALQYGDIDKIDGDFRDYLDDRELYNEVKVYNGLIFIHQGRTLITVYEVPDRFKGYNNE